MGFWAEQVVPRLSDTMKLARDARSPPSGLSGCRQSGRHRKFVGVTGCRPEVRRAPSVAGLPSRSWCAQCTVGRRVADTSRNTITTGGTADSQSLVAAHVRNRGPSGRLRAARQRHRDRLRLEVHRHRPRRPPSPASTATNKRRSRRPPDLHEQAPTICGRGRVNRRRIWSASAVPSCLAVAYLASWSYCWAISSQRIGPVLTRPIRWELIAQQYDQLAKYATALPLGTAEADQN